MNNTVRIVDAKILNDFYTKTFLNKCANQMKWVIRSTIIRNYENCLYYVNRHLYESFFGNNVANE